MNKTKTQQTSKGKQKKETKKEKNQTKEGNRLIKIPYLQEACERRLHAFKQMWFLNSRPIETVYCHKISRRLSASKGQIK